MAPRVHPFDFSGSFAVKSLKATVERCLKAAVKLRVRLSDFKFLKLVLALKNNFELYRSSDHVRQKHSSLSIMARGMLEEDASAASVLLDHPTSFTTTTSHTKTYAYM
jgi:hypothetical protein